MEHSFFFEKRCLFSPCEKIGIFSAFGRKTFSKGGCNKRFIRIKTENLILGNNSYLSSKNKLI